jgi:hypothetical protein
LHWTWDQTKERRNRRDHGIDFGTAQHVFADWLAVSWMDPYPDEQRWRTIGLVGQVIVLVVHTAHEWDPEIGDEVGRIISARKATPRERRAYEAGGS